MSDLWKLLEPIYGKNLIKNDYEYITTWKNILHVEWPEFIVSEKTKKHLKMLFFSFKTIKN